MPEAELGYDVKVYLVSDGPVQWTNIPKSLADTIVNTLAEKKCYRTETNQTLIMSDKVVWVRVTEHKTGW